MADTKFKVTIITPDGTVYDNDNATMVIMNTSGGQMGIMAKHVPVLASLTISELRIKHDQGTDEIAAVNGGIMQFDGETALITADSAEMPEKIDVARAEEAKQRAEEAIRKAKEAHRQNDLARAEVHLKRAVNRLKVSKFKQK
ncbi:MULTISPECIES: F0F1 ATP synthase subunit epsilon [Limosilactobacillus]|jgi:F-type H+-transporting ATPase subunit epsilon|uniref:ATP synthase epsilon chain n=1 Tax=Limosilactobacillus portuensis TaxID=2742601 RepID=A0ABS6IW84_9LACO|nr:MULTISPECIES: F0F1 ATP synthase subunit epsilon [Limosilactobacillus]MDU1505527.1 F0F1 ATP synthase subunit epsilon [Limosilactobacillus vaginalis]PMC28290.1 F0F1 ATP synthase subunit epsilon [Gardnerella vaginalis]MBD8086480.1 F0F1 ATP synthase subunit epsilon [Limosilactobacillus portuensis]MBU9695783.1 F0F1 ATP synthase subunit epsilon [Limosilactobacillus portuensis]MEC4741065.1 F0F1 ATP synthase subunit epsilon [Limosilactobacillus sp. c10Ua_36]